MVKDITDTINALRNAAIGRCRERLELAAQKAKGFIKNGQSLDRSDKIPTKKEYGITSCMKRKHGL